MTELYTKTEVANALRVSLRTVDTLISKGELRIIKPGGGRLVRIEPAELKRFVEASRSVA